MFEDALRYPTAGDDALETIAIGGILGLLGVLLLPVFIVYGYLVHVIRTVGRGDDETLLTFDDWGTLLVDGLKGFVIVLVYTVVPALALGIAVTPVVLFTSVSADGGGGASGLLTTVLLLAVFVVATLSLLVLLAAIYVVPVAVTAFATTDRLGAAFTVSELRRIGGSSQFITGWLVALVLSILVGIVTGIVASTIIGLLAVPFLNFYGNVVAAYALGAGVRPTTADETNPEVDLTD